MFAKEDFYICLAPMVGLTHLAFREALSYYMPLEQKAIWPTEMISSHKLSRKNEQSSISFFKKEESYIVPQILANQKEATQKAVSFLQERGADAIDINMGCPVKKALRHNYGVALMGDPEYAAEVVRFATELNLLPVSVKFRAGEQKDKGVLKSFVAAVEDAGSQWLTLHPRTADQKRRGSSDWSQISYLKSITDLPVIGNGDIQVLGDVYRMREETGCDKVMVGRALTLRPWLLWQWSEDQGLKMSKELEGREAPRTAEEEGGEYGRHLKRLNELCYLYYSEKEALRKMRFYIKVSSSWLVFGHDFYSRSTLCKSKDDFSNLIKSFFSKKQSVMQRTFLRY